MGDVAAGNGQSLPIMLALDHLLKGEAFFRAYARERLPTGWGAGRACEAEGLTLRELPLHCFAYFSISCSQKLAMRFQLYFSSTASRVATGYMASAAVPSVKLLQSLYFLLGFDMS